MFISTLFIQSQSQENIYASKNLNKNTIFIKKKRNFFFEMSSIIFD